MRKIGLLIFFAVFACSLSAQNRLSVFIGNANRYASVDLSDFCRRLCVEYDISAESLNDYYRRCGRDWGHVGLALEIARTSGRSMRDVCDHYRRYRSEGWSRILIELGIGPESSYRTPFYDRVHSHSDYWYEHYNSYCQRHGRYHPHRHPHKYKKYPKHGYRKYGRYHDDDDADDDDDDD